MLSVNNWKYLKWYMHMLLRHFSDEISVFARKKPLWHPIGTLPPFTHLPFASASWGKTPEFSHQFETRIDGVGVFDVHLKVASRFSLVAETMGQV